MRFDATAGDGKTAIATAAASASAPATFIATVAETVAATARAVAVAAAVLIAAGAAVGPVVGPATAQTCSPASGGPPCETSVGIAGLADPTGIDLTIGNPIHPITGNKYQEEVDALPLPGFLGLEIRRHFNSSYASADGPWGRGWSLSYDTRVYRTGRTLQIVQADGRRLVFDLPREASAPGGGHRPGEAEVASSSACSPASPGQGQLFLEAGGYRWLWPQQRELIFDHDGRLTRIRPRGGSESEAVRIERRDDGRISRVTDPAGRVMTLHYDAAGYLSRIDHPLGRWDYAIDSSGRILSVVSPDAVTRRYRYDGSAHPALFTAIARTAGGEPERVLGQWAYDALGRAERYHRADGSVLSIAYQQQEPPGLSAKAGKPAGGKPARPETASRQTVSVLTNALGGRTWFTAVEIAGRWRVTEIRGPGCEECGASNIRMRYDRDGQLLARWNIGGDGHAYLRDRSGRVVQVLALSRPDAAGLGPVKQTDRQGSPQPASNPYSQPYLQRFEYADEFTILPRLIARPSVVAGREHRTLLERDERGNLVRLLESGYAPDVSSERGGAPMPIARTFSLRYQQVGDRRVLAELDGPLPNGATADPSDSDITRWHYDAATGLPLRIDAPGGVSRRFLEHDPGGRPAAVAFSDGHREVEERHSYDVAGAILRTAYTAWLIDGAGRRVPDSRVAQQWSRSFDPQGRLEQVVNAAGQRWRYGWDAAGRLQSITDARGYRSVLARDAEGQIRVAALHEPG
jgi:YD repeat-containing protein